MTRWNAFSLRVLLAACAAAASFAASARSEMPSRIQVIWAPAKQLTEVKDNPMDRGMLRVEDWQKDISDHLRIRADRALPPGQQLEVTINDIKLAGAYEPWRGPDVQDIRFLKDIYPPRLNLHYKLLASDGSTVREGDAKLWDGAYLQHSMANASDPLRFDKRMIDDWIGKEFRTK